MKKITIISLKLLLFFTVLTGVIYPVLMTLISGIMFPYQSSGSFIAADKEIKGSELIGQDFSSAEYFTPRPSAISYNPMPSGASNLGPTSRVLKDSTEQRRKRYIEFNHLPADIQVPEDALFSSASGVDPHVSLQNTLLQMNRVAEAKNIKKDEIKELINRLIEKPQFGILGEERVNVFKLNLELDKLH